VDAKLSALSDYASPALADLIYCVGDPGGTPVSRKVTLVNLAKAIGAAFERIAASGQSLTGSQATSLVDLATTWNTTGTPTGIRLNVTDTASNANSLFADFQVGGSSRISLTKSGAIRWSGNSGTDMRWTGSTVITDAQLGGSSLWTLTTLWLGNPQNCAITTDAADIVAQRRGTNAQAYRVYNTFTDASNYERGFMRWLSNRLEIGAEAAGTGTLRDLFVGSGVKGIVISPSGNSISMIPAGGGGPVFTTSAMVFSGWNGGTPYMMFGNVQTGNANRVGSDVHLYPLGGSGNATTGQVALFASLASASGTSGHSFEMAVRTFLPATAQPGIQFGGSTASFPAMKRLATVLQSRLADDSDFAPLQGQLRTHANAATETITATRTLVLFDAAGAAYKVPCVPV
jgi:hypothetical protein